MYIRKVVIVVLLSAVLDKEVIGSEMERITLKNSSGEVLFHGTVALLREKYGSQDIKSYDWFFKNGEGFIATIFC